MKKSFSRPVCAPGLPESGPPRPVCAPGLPESGPPRPVCAPGLPESGPPPPIYAPASADGPPRPAGTPTDSVPPAMSRAAEVPPATGRASAALSGFAESVSPLKPKAAAPPRFALVFFDGVCNLCGFFVHFILKRDKKEIFRFAPLQGETAARYAAEGDSVPLRSGRTGPPPASASSRPPPETSEAPPPASPPSRVLQGETGARKAVEKDSRQIVLLHKGRFLLGFPAVQEIFCLLYPRMSWIFRRIPGKRLYQIIAASRYRLFGRKKALFRPDAKHSRRFLP